MAKLRNPARVAVVGAGYFSRFHCDAWHRIEGADMVGICDSDTDKAARLAGEFGGNERPLPVFGDVGEMISALDIDLVDIVAPPAAHNELIEAIAPRAGHIICQKPFCGGLEQARQAIAACARYGTRIAVHENFRFQPWYREARRLIDAGAMGDIHQITFRLRPGDGQGDDAYLDRQPYFQQMERFLIHETAVHWIDTFRYLAGEISGLFASLRRLNPVIAGEDAGLVLFDFENGVRALFDGNRLADHRAENRRLTMGEMSIEGTGGTLRLDGYGRLWLRAFGSNEEREQDFAWNDHLFGGDCVYHCASHILSAWQKDQDCETEASRYLQNLIIEEIIYDSAKAGQYQAVARDSLANGAA